MMDTLNTDSQQLDMLRESAADFTRRSSDMKRLRERRGTLPGYEPKALAQMAALGWFGILVGEDQGGLGLGFAEMAVVMQELGKGLLGDPLAPAVLATRVLRHLPDSTLRSKLLVGVADASLLPCVAWQEGLGGIDPLEIACRAEVDGDGVRLHGSKRFVAGAAGAAGYVVSAKSAAGLGLYWVEPDVQQLILRHEWRADETPMGVLQLDGVLVPPHHVLAQPGAGALAALERAVDETAVLISAEMLGVMESALQMALAYMRTRVQFDKPIGSFQALQHKAADLYVQQELARAVLQDALRALDAGAPSIERARLASRCKARASDAGLRITREVIQLHGAIAFTDEYDAGLYLKRALVLSAWLGNASTHRRRFATLQRETGAL